MRNLTPPRQPGRRQIEDEATLLAAIERIEKQYRVRSLFDMTYEREVEERHVRAYRGKARSCGTQSALPTERGAQRRGHCRR